MAKTKRKEIRLSEEAVQLLDRASAYVGQSPSTFILEAATTRARQVIEEHESLHLPDDQAISLTRLLAGSGENP